MINKLVDKRRNLKTEIVQLEKQKNSLIQTIKEKKERLDYLENLTVNQIDMFDET